MKKSFSRIGIGCVIYTHERIDDAKINMEIIRSAWHKSGFFASIKIVHAYNGNYTWYPKKYLEDIIVRQKNPGHFRGAADLIDGGLLAVKKNYPAIQYVVVLAADTWCFKPDYIASTIEKMNERKKSIATCFWGLPARYKEKDFGLATDFFIVNLDWAIQNKLFPMRYYEFWKKYHEIISYMKLGGNVSIERLFLARLHDASFREHNDNVRRKSLAESNILLLKERMPVHSGKTKQGYWIRSFHWPKIGLVTHHEPFEKQIVLRKFRNVDGKNISALKKTKSFQYYNQGRTVRNSYD